MPIDKESPLGLIIPIRLPSSLKTLTGPSSLDVVKSNGSKLLSILGIKIPHVCAFISSNFFSGSCKIGLLFIFIVSYY